MDIKFVGESFKSIPLGFAWENIPQLAVVTGPNGVGKSHLLEAIHEELRDRQVKEQKPPGRVQFRNVSYRPGDAVLLRGQWSLNSSIANVNTFFNEAKKLQSALEEHNDSALRQNRNEADYHAARRYQEFTLAIQNHREPNWEAIKHELPGRVFFSCRRDLSHLSQELSNVFLSYHLRRRDRCHDKKENEDQATLVMGKPPWTEFNELLEASGLAFRCEPPVGGYDAQYHLQLVCQSRGIRITPNQLSSGEQTIIGLAIWLLAANTSLPPLLLLDEPDAHLHGAMVPHFLKTIEHIAYVWGSRVIMTTHRAETLIRAPLGNAFEMERRASTLHVVPVTDRDKTVGRLTSGYFAVLGEVRCIFVEDHADKDFYGMVHSVLTQEPNCDVRPVVFVPVAKKADRDVAPGGKDAVRAWVQKLVSSGLSGLVRGLIDRDAECEPKNGIIPIDRYEFENYLADPFVLYSALLRMKKAPAVEGCDIPLGDHRSMRRMPKAVLQRIADTVTSLIEEKVRETNADASNERWTETYITGQQIQLPMWLRDLKGGKILHCAQQVWNGLNNYCELRKAFESVAMVPVGLRDALRACGE